MVDAEQDKIKIIKVRQTTSCPTIYSINIRKIDTWFSIIDSFLTNWKQCNSFEFEAVSHFLGYENFSSTMAPFLALAAEIVETHESSWDYFLTLFYPDIWIKIHITQLHLPNF